MILKQDGNIWTIAVAAQPEEGKANRELIKFSRQTGFGDELANAKRSASLSKKLKKQVRIRSGFGNSTKILEIFP